MPSFSSPKSATSSTTPLSKTAIYQELPTPVSDGKPSKSASNPNAILAGRKEAALAEFLEQASHYNFQVAKTRKNKQHNHVGNRPLSKSDFLQYLKGRALTLVGGGFQVSQNKVTSTIKRRNNGTSTKWGSSRKRQRSSKDNIQSSQSLESTECASSTPQTVEFLKHINRLWNNYAHSALLRPKSTTGTDNSWQLVSSAVANMEWVGARVRVEHCPSYRHTTGRSGIVVAVTSCTWCIVFTEMIKDDVLTNDVNNGNETKEVDKHKPSKTALKPCYIPKSETEVSVLLPLPTITNEAISTIDEFSPTKEFISLLINLSSTR